MIATRTDLQVTRIWPRAFAIVRVVGVAAVGFAVYELFEMVRGIYAGAGDAILGATIHAVLAVSGVAIGRLCLTIRDVRWWWFIAPAYARLAMGLARALWG